MFKIRGTDASVCSHRRRSANLRIRRCTELRLQSPRFPPIFNSFLTQDTRTSINTMFSLVKRENSKQANNFTISRFPVDVLGNDCRVVEDDEVYVFSSFLRQKLIFSSSPLVVFILSETLNPL